MGFTEERLATISLEKDPFKCSYVTACKHHLEADLWNKCTLARARRTAYTLLDSCCAAMGTAPVPGRHRPHVNTMTHDNMQLSTSSWNQQEPVRGQDDHNCCFHSCSNCATSTIIRSDLYTSPSLHIVLSLKISFKILCVDQFHIEDVACLQSRVLTAVAHFPPQCRYSRLKGNATYKSCAGKID